MKKLGVVFLALCLLTAGCTWNPPAQETIADPPESLLTVFSPMEEERCQPFLREFEERTGIWVQLETADSRTLLDRIQENPGCCDVLFGFAPWTLSNASVCAQDDEASLQTLFYSVPVIVCNPHLIRKNLPTGFLDLTDERWQGSICVPNPEDHWISLAFLGLMEQLAGDGFQPLPRFARNLARVTSGTAEALELVSSGTCAVGIASECDALNAIQSGAGLSIVYPKEGSFLFSAVAAVSGEARNKEAARAFLEFLREPETMRYAWEVLHLRTDATRITELLPDARTVACDIPSSRQDLLKQWKNEVQP